MRLDRLFTIVDDPSSDAVHDQSGQSGEGVGGGASARKLEFFRLFLLLHVAVRGWISIESPARWWQWAAAFGLTAALGASFHPRLARQASLGAALVLAAKLPFTLPTTSNHYFLELLLASTLAAFDLADDAERALAARTVKWLALIVLFWSGAQKLLYGTYFHGQFLAFAVAQVDTFAKVLGWLLPASELARLRGYAPLDPTASYRTDAPLFVLASNLSWLGEIGAAVLIALPTTRRLGVVLAIALVVAIEVAAREVLFGVLFLQLALLFVPGAVNRRTLPVVVLLYADLLAMRAHVIPTSWSTTH